ncbi:MAG TPA: chloride channel protein, partial [Planctomycetaceae bacterium]
MLQRWINGLRRTAAGLDLRSSGKWLVLSAAIGIVAGLGAFTFQLASQTVLHFTLAQIAGYDPPEPAGEHRVFERQPRPLSPWLIVAVMAVGGLASGVIVYTFAPEAEGHGTDAAIESFHQKRGFIRGRIPIIKMVTSAITIGTGGSGGREGPIAQIGAGFGSFLATLLKLSARDRRIMLAAGMGAGVGSIFRAPLAGALFAAEILYSDAELESDVIVPAAISSIVGYSVFSLF